MTKGITLENYPELLGTADLVKLLGQSMPTVRRLIHDGELPSVRIGRRYYVPRSLFVEYLERELAGRA